MIAKMALEIAQCIRQLEEVRGVDLDQGPEENPRTKRESVSFRVLLRDGSQARVTVDVKPEKQRVVGFAAATSEKH